MMKNPRNALGLLSTITFVWCFTTLCAHGQTFVYANDNPTGPNTVAAFSVGSSGALTPIAGSPFSTGGTGALVQLYGPLNIATSNNFLFVANLGSNDVSVFSINPSTGALTLVPGSPFATGSSGPTYGISLGVTPDGRFLVAGNSSSSVAAVFSIAANGALTPISGSPFALGVEPLGGEITPSGAFSAFTTPNGVGVFQIAATGGLTPVSGSPFVVGDYLEGIGVSCSGNRLFASGFSTSTVATVDVFAIAVNGSLTPVSGSPFPPGVGATSPAVLLSPDGKFLFAGNTDNVVSVFKVASDGTLALVPGSPFPTNSSGSDAVGLATDQAGKFLFAANYPASISVLSVAADGSLAPVVGSPFADSDPGTTLYSSIVAYPAPTCSNPVPILTQPLLPDTVLAQGTDFSLTVNGSGFITGSVVNWNGLPLTTTFVTRNQLTATVPAADIAAEGTATITVANPAPGGGTSNAAYFTVTSPVSPIALVATSLFSDTVRPNYVFVGDFNRDGKLDLAVATGGNAGPGHVSIALGNGDGTFRNEMQFPTGTKPYSATVGDFNGDGKPDLAVANYLDNTVSVLLGNGTGTFQTQQTFATGGHPDSITADDFNGDGKLDLAVSNLSDSTVSVLLGNGDGTFQTQLPFNANSAPYFIAAGDFNGDGVLDLVVTNTVGANPLSVLLGNGDGTFQAPLSTPGNTPLDLAVADVDGDGKLDVITTNTLLNQVSVFLGNGDGTFKGAQTFSTGVQPESLTIADFDGDGKLDLAVFDALPNAPPSSVSILLGNGDGTFQSNKDYPLALGNGDSIAVGDFNGDGRMDLAIGTNTISVLLQSPVVTLSPTALTFGDQLVGTPSSSQQLQISNTGSANLTISSAAIGGLNPGDFQVTPCALPAIVQPGGTCDAQFTFTPSAPGSRTATFFITDNAGGSPQSVSLSGTGVSQLTVPATSLLAGMVGTTYNAVLQATGGKTPYTWTKASGNLPTGVNLNGATGGISGTPTAAGTFTFTVSVKDADGFTATSPTLTIMILPQLTVPAPSLPVGMVGAVYNQTLQAAGGATPYTWTKASGNLPTGVNLNSVTGGISGTPTAAGTFTFTVSVKDADGFTATSPTLTIVILSQLTIPATSLPAGMVGTAYNAVLQATGGKTPYTWTKASGNLPTGVNLNSATGVISGTPTAAGTFTFTVSVKDTDNFTVTKAFGIVIVSQLTVTTTSNLPLGETGTPYSQALQAAGGAAPYTWSASPGPPPGLSLSAAGTLVGTPTAAGAFNFTVSVKDSDNFTATKTFSILIASKLTLTTTGLPAAIIGTAYSQTMQAVGGTAPYTWSSAPSLPPGLSLSPGGTISGTPTSVGTFNFTVSVQDVNALTVARAFSIVVVSPLAVTTTSLPSATIGAPFSQTLQASGGTTPYTWSIPPASLPPGLSLSTAGTISGTPTTAGTFNFTVKVTDANGIVSTSGPLSIGVAAPAQAPTCPSPTVQGASSNPLSVTVTSNCSDSQTSITSTSIDWGDGTPVSSGTTASHPYAAANTYSITVRATNASNLSSSVSVGVTVTAPITTPVPQGQAANQTAQVTAPLGMPSAQVTYQCSDVNGPSGVKPLSYYNLSCNINGQGTTSTVTLTNTATQVSFAVQTNSPLTIIAEQPVLRRGNGGTLYAAILMAPGVVLLGIGRFTKRRRKPGAYLGLMLLGLLMGNLLACGGGAFVTRSLPPPQNVTPTGIYTVTGTGSGSTGTQSTITVGFTVTIGQ
jgi:6-phosphogluconolactonase (cycloisomerase 2 family)